MARILDSHPSDPGASAMEAPKSALLVSYFSMRTEARE
uniref:Uncharacterized protein n=1 Tax=Physcomitrium patens TaxID=3218 RepID=A0A2K1IGY6_PHYPA|nr:hypothetical protein PHYPA_029126 [Physcomitrium patens]